MSLCTRSRNKHVIEPHSGLSVGRGWECKLLGLCAVTWPLVQGLTPPSPNWDWLQRHFDSWRTDVSNWMLRMNNIDKSVQKNMYRNQFFCIYLFICNFWPNCQGPQVMHLFASLTLYNKLPCDAKWPSEQIPAKIKNQKRPCLTCVCACCAARAP